MGAKLLAARCVLAITLALRNVVEFMGGFRWCSYYIGSSSPLGAGKLQMDMVFPPPFLGEGGRVAVGWGKALRLERISL